MDDLSPSIGHALESLARSQPAAPALHVPGRTSLNYADLGAQIRYVRERLGSWDFVRGDVIAGVIPTRPEMAVACATVPAAATFSPLSPAFTADVYCEILARLRPKALIVPADPNHPVRVAARRCGVAEIALTADPSSPAGMFSLDLARHARSLHNRATVSPEVAYVLCTSGTTGPKKLVPLPHRQITLYSRTLYDWLKFSARDVGCHLQPMHLAIGLRTVLIAPLLGGTSVVCLPESDVDGFYAALDEHRLTWLTAGFTVHRAILQRATAHRELLARSSLRLLQAGSGRLEPEEIDRIEQMFRVPVLAPFSTTETGVITTTPLPPRIRKRGSVGLPLCNQVAVMNQAKGFCPAEQVGEIVVRGPLVFDGYLDDPQATAAAFVDGWFRTGDLGRFDEDGYLFLTGRVNDIINRGGEKISPAEIDSAIEAIAGVRAAATFGIPHPTLGEEIVAAVVKQGDAAIEESDIVDRVREQMGPTRVPRQIYFVDQLPRTDGGKLRRTELTRLLGPDSPRAISAGESGSDETGATASPLETALAGLWASVLNVNRIGPDDDFFILGGDSLSGVRLLASVEAVFGVDLSLQLLFQDAATVAGMARAIDNARARGARAPQEPNDSSAPKSAVIPHRQHREPAALSGTQRRMWLLSKLDSDSPAYNQSSARRLSGQIEAETLRRAVGFVTQRHEILRTGFALIDDEPRQVVRAAAVIDLRTVDLAATPAPQREQAMQRTLLAESRRPFDLESGSLLRCVLVRLAEREHVILRVWHHIISDGWSAGIFDRELSLAYRAYARGEEPALPELPIQYADYAVWQREWLQGEVLDQQLSYWKAKLAGLSTLELPTDRPRPPAQSHHGAHVALDLPEPLTRALKALGRREGATLFMTLLAAFQVLLHRYSGQDDIAVGTPIAGRGRAELEALIGFFANTLVLRSDLSGDPGFSELLARVRESALGAYTHQDVPFEKLVEELAPERDLSRNPLFQVMFALQNTPGSALALKGVQVSRVPLEGHSAKFDLSLSVRETSAGLHTRWEFSTDLFDAQTIERMARHFERLLEGIVADAQQRIGELPLLTEAERHQLLVEWNDTALDYPKNRCIQELFEAQVARAPEAVAVVFEDQQLTYGELNARANRLAHHLISLGVGLEVLVGICMERSLELVIGLLGILKAGGAYVPLDPSYPKKRLAFMLEDTDVRVLLTQQALRGRLPQYDDRIVCVDYDWPQISAQSEANPPTITTAASLAYVIYTSGSTGQPKGVLVPHRGVVRLVKGADYVSLNAHDTLLHLAPLAFDASTFELWGALLNGGRVVVMPPGQPSLAEIGTAIREHRVTTLWLPAGLFHLMVDERLDDLKPLRQLLAGGDVLSAQHLVKARRALPGCRLINGYGPTENTTFTCCYTVVDERKLIPTVPIGRPIANTRVYILDRRLQPVPVGVVGELCAAGAGVARGYWRRPELSAERFVPDPHVKTPGAQMYRTGDLARYLPDGNIEFLGRADSQIKLRGFRIELGEIEAVLCEHSTVRQAVVAVREVVPGDKRLVAYVVPTEESSPGTESLRATLRERLPDYMRPSAYVVLERLPLTPNGKIDRRALFAPPCARAEGVSRYVAPCNSLEEVVAEVWREALKIERVSMDDNFFELGGHSLLAAQVVARLAKLLKVEVPLRRFFEAVTASHLAAEVAKLLGAHETRQVAMITSVTRNTDSPVSYSQQALWFLDRLWPGKSVYNIPAAWRLRGSLDTRTLQKSFDAVVARHEALRTTIASSEGRPVQVIAPSKSVALVVTDLSAMPHAEREARGREITRIESDQPFDLEAGPLLRAHLLRLAAEEHLLLVAVHHIISDGWSAGIFDRELSIAYRAYARGEEPALPELPIQYADYALWQREWMQGEALNQQLNYWKAKLAGVATLEWPTDRPRPPAQSHHGARLVLELPATLTRALKALGRREGATLFMTLLAAFQVLLHRYSGQDDIAVGTPIAGRRRSELEGLIGFFANTLVLRSDLSGDPGFRVLLAQVRESALGAYTHQDVPFEKLVEELAPSRDLSRNPLFQVMFALQNTPGSGLALEGVQVSRVSLEGHSAKFDLSLSVRETSAGLHTRWEFSTDLFDAQTIERMARHFERLLGGIVADAQQRIGELPLLTEAERHQLLVDPHVQTPGAQMYRTGDLARYLPNRNVELLGRADNLLLALEPVVAQELRPYCAPRDDLEQTLCRLWEEKLGAGRIGIDDDFFELGGHSLLAASLFSRLDQALGRALPLATLFAAPTVRELARFYRDGADPAFGSTLIPITSGGTMRPVFAVPGVYGNVVCFADIARELGPDQPFYGLQSVGLDGEREPLDSIEEMATHYVREIRHQQPRGPYYFIGACFGAIVALEMARQVLDAGDDVAFLGLLDPSSLRGDVAGKSQIRLPPWFKRVLALGNFVADRLRLYRKEIRGLGWAERWRFIGKRVQVLGEVIQQRNLLRADYREFNQRRVYDANLAALLLYERRSLRDRSVAFEIFGTARMFNKTLATKPADWDALAGGSVAYHKVMGKDSGDMLQGDNAKSLAGVLSARLQSAQRAQMADDKRA